MTDSEIIKALRNIKYGGHSCTNCKYGIKKGEDRCGLKGCNIARKAFHLINRQMAEIERLKGYINQKLSGASDLLMAYDIAVAKAEAIKEFAERLESKLANNTDISNVGYQSVIYDVDSIVKEMVGDDNAE